MAQSVTPPTVGRTYQELRIEKFCFWLGRTLLGGSANLTSAILATIAGGASLAMMGMILGARKTGALSLFTLLIVARILATEARRRMAKKHRRKWNLERSTIVAHSVDDLAAIHRDKPTPVEQRIRARDIQRKVLTGE
jgi:hypothetical protein